MACACKNKARNVSRGRNASRTSSVSNNGGRRIIRRQIK